MEYEGSTGSSDEAAISDAYQDDEYEDQNDKERFETQDAQFRQRYEVTYQYSRDTPSNPKCKARNHFRKMGANVGIKTQKIWRYFPHYSSKKLTDGVLWDILEMQGRHKMWYIGSSVCFESLKSVVEYNKLLLSLMEPIYK